MERIAFLLRIKPGMAEEYDHAHRNVWPELLSELKAMGACNYSIFRRDEQIFLYLHVPNCAAFMQQMAASELNLRWQAKMAPLFEPVPGLQSFEPYAMLREVFYME